MRSLPCQTGEATSGSEIKVSGIWSPESEAHWSKFRQRGAAPGEEYERSVAWTIGQGEDLYRKTAAFSLQHTKALWLPGASRGG